MAITNNFLYLFRFLVDKYNEGKALNNFIRPANFPLNLELKVITVLKIKSNLSWL